MRSHTHSKHTLSRVTRTLASIDAGFSLSIGSYTLSLIESYALYQHAQNVSYKKEITFKQARHAAYDSLCTFHCTLQNGYDHWILPTFFSGFSFAWVEKNYFREMNHNGMTENSYRTDVNNGIGLIIHYYFTCCALMARSKLFIHKCEHFNGVYSIYLLILTEYLMELFVGNISRIYRNWLFFYFYFPKLVYSKIIKSFFKLFPSILCDNEPPSPI